MFSSAAPTPDEGSLTRREAEVLDLIARGLSNHEIAEATSLSINSIKSFIRSAYRKIGVEKRSHAIQWALDRGYGPATSA
ncbi:response regulator transcription factor [Nocardioides sp.]|uniref:response regulator transcription factor n=1 Tax=Nocardioides sp. TaxID=35761 RepID=UPI00272776B6|nr:LuxR C-terminal-related transcriptional regulator [Nocardioides sp.]MDO9458127.1 LuxR C-terminal-related transcriptional regulator [Nocardioides sp.]